jgi:hypothetical protein
VRPTQPGGIGSLESIFGLRISLKIRAGGPVKDNSIPTWFLAPIDCLKIPAQAPDSNGRMRKVAKLKKDIMLHCLKKSVWVGGRGGCRG